MSTFSAWSYTADVTFWRPTLDETGQPISYVRSVFKCSYVIGGRQMLDSAGEEFTPATRIWLESSPDSAPRAGDMVSIGSSTEDSPSAGSETVRIISSFDPSTFNEGLPDYMVATS